MFDIRLARRGCRLARDPLITYARLGVDRRGCMKYFHEFRDPVHDFITVTSHEREIINSRAVQRLRHINQLALTPLVYPGTTHKRFEHSLGVMHLAGVAFDVLTEDQNLSDDVKDLVKELNEKNNFSYWRSVVRMAALCHDLGHLPFSHAAEHETLPDGYSHERLSADIIQGDEFAALLNDFTPPIQSDVVAKLAIGPKESKGTPFSVWEAILSEIVTGNAFGVDRMDYLLRDSLHAGVTYGHFDHRRLIQSLRLLSPAEEPSGDEESAPVVGVDSGGINSAEALLHARYHMFGQMYFHPVRVAYDLHLVDFLKAWLPEGGFSVDVEEHLNMTDNEVWVAIREASDVKSSPAHEPARRIWRRNHYKVLYVASVADQQILSDPGQAVLNWAIERYGSNSVRRRHPVKSGGTVDFPVRQVGGTIASSLSVSETIARLPTNEADIVFIDPEIRDRARRSLTPELLEKILREAAEQQTEAEDTESASLELNPPASEASGDESK
jgi:HD superfamily phosphohydrolase